MIPKFIYIFGLIAMASSTNVCISRNPRPNQKYSGYTRYSPPVTTGRQDQVEGCSPITLFFLGRNNIRHPQSQHIEQMSNTLTSLRQRILDNQSNGELCAEDLQGFVNWQLHSNDHNVDELTEDGYRSAMNLGRRWKERFPELLAEYSPSMIFANVYANRTWNTAYAFSHGLFNKTVADEISGVSFGMVDARVLNFNSMCEKQDDRDDIDDELEEFQEQTAVQSMIQRMEKRLGFDLNFDDIDLMYQTCAIENSINQTSAWCTAFSSSDLTIMEYKSDMLSYQKFGPSDDINEDQTCVLMKKLTEYLSNDQAMLPKAVFYFAKDDAVLPFLSKLRFFDDEEELEGDSLDEAHEERDSQSNEGRKWRMSKLNPLGANVALALYNCQNEFKVKVFLNEKAIIIPPCSREICPLQEFFGDTDDWADDCDFDDICDHAITTSYSNILFVCLVVMSFIYQK